MTKQQTTRQELYDLIWNHSATKAAKDYSITFTALVRICKEYNIPRPDGHYWTAIRLGRSVTKTSLPPTPSGLTDTITIEPPEKRSREHSPSADAKPQDVEPPSADNQPAVPASFKHCHPLVRSSWEFFKHSTSKDPQGRLEPSARQKCLDLTVTKAQMRRALSIFQRIIEACEEQGWSVHKPERTYYRKYSETLVVIDGIETNIAIHEPAVRRSPTDVEKQAAAESWLAPKTFFNATGRFRVGIGAMRFEGRHAVEETADNPLEKRIPEIIEALKQEADDCRKQRAYYAEQARIRAEGEQVRLAELQKREQELQRQRDLEQLASRWQTGEQVRNLAAAVEKHLTSSQSPPAASRWLAWARNYANKIDPIQNGTIEKAINSLPSE